MPVISAIVPSYNTPEKLINRCLSSILAQTMTDFELIVVNDGSDAEFAGALKTLCAKDNRIVLIDKDNEGVSVARNIGTSISSGDYILYIDADDYINERYFEEALGIATETNSDVLYSFVPHKNALNRGINVFSPSEPVYRDVDDSWLIKYTIGYTYQNGEVIFGRGPWARFVKAGIAKSVSFKEGVPLGEDVLWNLDLIKMAKNKVITNRIWYYYVDQEDSVTRRFDPDILEKIIPFYNELRINIEDGFIPYEYYLQRIFRDLRRYAYKSYFGNTNNKDSFIRKWKGFNALKKTYPWSDLRDSRIVDRKDIKDRVKIFAFKNNILYLIWRMTEK